jgi:hypothetical protein
MRGMIVAETDFTSSLFDLAKLKELGGFKAGDLLAVDPKLYTKFLRHLCRTVKHDVVTKNMVFLTGLSAYTPEPINLFLRGESSIGKTYNVVQTLKYFPKEDTWLLGGLSPTALIHQYGLLVDKNGDIILPWDRPDKEAPIEEKEAWRQRLIDARYLIDLRQKILVFLEAPRYETFNMLRPILSHDAFEISYRFTDKSGKGQLQTQHVVIRGWPATIFCSTQEKYVQDLATRGFTVTPETKQRKFQAANTLTGKKAAFPWKFDNDFDFMLLEGYIRFLKNHLQDFKALVPFGVELAKTYPSKFPRSMRDFKQILNLIKVSALFHLHQRPVLVRKLKVEIQGKDPNVPEYREFEEHYIMATKRDYDLVMDLWNQIRETTETSAPGHIINFYHAVVEDVAREKPEFTIEDLADKWNGKFEDKKSTDAIRNWTNFLCSIGYISKREDPDNKKRNLFRIIHANEKIRENTILPFSAIFSLESLKAWLKEANSITAKNHISLEENLISENETNIDNVFNKYFLSENESLAVINLGNYKAASGESVNRIDENHKIVHSLNFQLQDLKAVFWADAFFDKHECGICGYVKPTSWKGETFKNHEIWLCEDCKAKWEKLQEVIH